MTDERDNPFRLVTPCSSCPFRSDLEFILGPGRSTEIAESLHDDETFHCHKTVDYAARYPDDEEETEFEFEGAAPEGEKLCAGALITMEKEGFQGRPQTMGMALNIYDPSRLKMDAPVYDSLDEWVDVMEERAGRLAGGRKAPQPE
jgi:hypothetical protein